MLRSSSIAEADALWPPLLLRDCGLNSRCGRLLLLRTEAGHRGPPVEPLLGLACGVGGARRRRGGRRGGAGRRMCGHIGGVGPAGVGGRTCRVGCVIDVLSINVGGIGDEGGATMSPASVALLEPKELDLRLDAVEKIETHCESVVVYCRKIVVFELRMQLCARSSDLELKSGSKIRALKSRRRSVSSVMSSYVALPGVGYLTIGMAQMAFLCWLQLAAVSRCRRSRLAIGSEVAELQNGNGTGNQAKRWWVFGFYSGGSQEMDWSSRAMAIVMNDCGGVGDSRLCLAPVAPEIGRAHV